jgi:hypothetical protein
MLLNGWEGAAPSNVARLQSLRALFVRNELYDPEVQALLQVESRGCCRRTSHDLASPAARVWQPPNFRAPAHTRTVVHSAPVAGDTGK